MKSVIVGSLVLSFAAGTALAQDAAPAAANQGQAVSDMVPLISIDTDRDGRISSAEAQSHSELRTSFSTLDTDRDGYLSQSEFAKWNKAQKQESSSSSSSSESARPSPSPSPSPSPNSNSPNSDSESPQ